MIDEEHIERVRLFSNIDPDESIDLLVPTDNIGYLVSDLLTHVQTVHVPGKLDETWSDEDGVNPISEIIASIQGVTKRKRLTDLCDSITVPRRTVRGRIQNPTQQDAEDALVTLLRYIDRDVENGILIQRLRETFQPLADLLALAHHDLERNGTI